VIAEQTFTMKFAAAIALALAAFAVADGTVAPDGSHPYSTTTTTVKTTAHPTTLSTKATTTTTSATSTKKTSTTTSSSASASGTFAAQCTALKSKLAGKLNDTTIWFSEYVTAGTNITFPDNDPSCTRPGQVVTVPICRVALLTKTAGNSSISWEAWLPSNYTGRFLSTGDGGLAGCIQYEDVAYGAELGFATVGANGGHNGTSGIGFYKTPGAVEDLSYRSVHTNAVLGKIIAQTFYGSQQKKSYYLGCSTGGRQGFKIAQDFTSDFDGYVLGAPAVAFANLTSWSASFYLITGPPGAPTFVTPDQWMAVFNEILAQCDALDGYVDGIIDNPSECYPRPEALICAPGQTPATNSSCLTGLQAETVRKVYSPLYGVNGTLVFPRMNPGSEITGEAYIEYSGVPFIYSSDWFKYVVYSDPNFDITKITVQDYYNAAVQDPYGIQSWKGNLSQVQANGAKILHYHGLYDQIITSENSPRYYDHVARTMNLPSSSLDDFYRFFRISGMGHCGGGPGATFIGQTAAQNATLDPDGNVLTAMVRWIEQGIAPDTILGTAYVNQTQGNPIAFQRRHCRYPLKNQYKGTGDPTKPDSWHCVLGP
jgi:feruloyl esterase